VRPQFDRGAVAPFVSARLGINRTAVFASTEVAKVLVGPVSPVTTSARC